MTVYIVVSVRGVFELKIRAHQVKSHTSGASQKAKEVLLDRKRNQHVLVSTSSNTVSLLSSTITVSLEEQVLRAEALQASDCVY